MNDFKNMRDKIKLSYSYFRGFYEVYEDLGDTLGDLIYKIVYDSDSDKCIKFYDDLQTKSETFIL